MKYIDIVDFLSKYKGREITYIPNQGNGGDSVIAFATLQLFDKLGLKYKLSKDKSYKNKLLFFGGGGSMNGMWSTGINFLKKNHKDNEIVILPHSYALIGKNQNELKKTLSSLGSNVTLMARELNSSEALSFFSHKSNIYYAHDLAFSITDIEQYKNASHIDVGYMMRTDGEGRKIWAKNCPGKNVDLSIELQVKPSYWNIFDRDGVNYSNQKMFEHISQYKTIHTNRLHAAIVGALCGNNVKFYRNTYWKNASIYNGSFKPLGYTNVEFLDKPNW